MIRSLENPESLAKGGAGTRGLRDVQGLDRFYKSHPEIVQGFRFQETALLFRNFNILKEGSPFVY